MLNADLIVGLFNLIFSINVSIASFVESFQLNVVDHWAMKISKSFDKCEMKKNTKI